VPRAGEWTGSQRPYEPDPGVGKYQAFIQIGGVDVDSAGVFALK
jgi:hypothetical protein